MKIIVAIPAYTNEMIRQLEKNARTVFTDSGGVQEETCILHTPCITLRDNTERTETLEVGANTLSGANPDKILECVNLMINRENNWQNPFGDGKSGEKIVEILRCVFDKPLKL